MDEDKIEEIVKWEAPRNVHETRQLLGLCGYYRRYVKDFSKHSAALHDLTKNNVPWEWGTKTSGAFEYLKTCLTKGHVLAMSTDEGRYVLDVDASDCAVGAVLQQEQNGQLKVIGYSSRTFNACERKYCITRKELAGLVFGLKQYRQYLLGRKSLVRTDHAALIYLRSAKELIGQQARWLDFIEEFDFDLQHRPGVTHGNADAMSRKPCDENGVECRQCHRKGLGAGPMASAVRQNTPPPNDTRRENVVTRARGNIARRPIAQTYSRTTPERRSIAQTYSRTTPARSPIAQTYTRAPPPSMIKPVWQSLEAESVMHTPGQEEEGHSPNTLLTQPPKRGWT